MYSAILELQQTKLYLMKTKTIISIAILLLVTIAFGVSRSCGNPLGDSTSPSIKFFEGSYAEAVKKSKETNKPIMVDMSTSWCGWCKKMKKYTFTDNAVVAYYNENFINLELDAEQGDGLVLAQRFQVQSYPTTIFLDKNETLILFAEGYMQADDFIKAGKAAYKNMK